MDLCAQVAEENGLEVMDQLSANPVATRDPTAASAVGSSTLTMAEEEQLSRRSSLFHAHVTHMQELKICLKMLKPCMLSPLFDLLACYIKPNFPSSLSLSAG